MDNSDYRVSEEAKERAAAPPPRSSPQECKLCMAEAPDDCEFRAAWAIAARCNQQGPAVARSSAIRACHQRNQCPPHGSAQAEAPKQTEEPAGTPCP
ncbi:hypothetical protein HPB52_004751 [Rhipicephalus sanguineus]|uniref:Uncharacterized protein n=1 Tax=Rhipicephalus sanguineus TaxID=34632 RepID=A0A9D4T550_RHISA|nr:hypothetical protein HPB52_004751 [Rhipicephalus sanguineus]